MDFDKLLNGKAHVSDIDTVLKEAADSLGVENLAYAGSNPLSGRVYGMNTYDPEWVSHYMAQGFYRIDPTLNEARRSIAPVDWSRLDRGPQFKQVFRDAHDFGISDQGLTIPVRGPLGDIGALSVTSSLAPPKWEALRSNVITQLQSLTVHIHDRVMREDSTFETLVHPNLSTRETEILQWIAAGKTQQDIGDILAISHRTVEVHLRSARTKLNALSTAQAIGRAIGLGLIYPE